MYNNKSIHIYIYIYIYIYIAGGVNRSSPQSAR